MTRVAVRLRDDDLATNRLRGIGYRAEVQDGWRGPVRKVRQDAVADMIARRSKPPPATITEASLPRADTGEAA